MERVMAHKDLSWSLQSVLEEAWHFQCHYKAWFLIQGLAPQYLIVLQQYKTEVELAEGQFKVFDVPMLDSFFVG